MSRWLNNRRVLVTRPEHQSEAICQGLRELGAQPIVFPAIEILDPTTFGALDRAIAELNTFDWIIFTSINGVARFFARLERQGAAPFSPNTDAGLRFRGRIAALGPGTAKALVDRGVAVDLLPQEFLSEGILEAIGDVDGKKILLPRAQIVRPVLFAGLKEKGALVSEVVVYRIGPRRPSAEMLSTLAQGVDLVVLTSPSIVESFVKVTEGVSFGAPLVVCIGPITAQAAVRHGLRADVVPREYSLESLLESLAHLDGVPSRRPSREWASI